MSDVIETEVIETEAGIFRIEVRPDDDPMSPRDAANLGVLVIDHDELDINETMRRELYMGVVSRVCTDHTAASAVSEALAKVRDGEVSVRAACRYLRLVTGAWAALPLYVSGRDWLTVSWDDDESDDTGVGIAGFIFDTAETRKDIGCTTPQQAHQWLREEVEALSRWTEGEYVMYTVERLAVDEWDEARPDVDDVEADPESYEWDVVESLSSIDSLDYALDEARGEVKAFTVTDFPSPRERRALAAQV